MTTLNAPAAKLPSIVDRMHKRWAACLCAVMLTACGTDVDALGRSHTVHGSLWTSFFATVSERYDAVSLRGAQNGASAGLSTQPQEDVWSVDETGLAQYLTSQQFSVDGQEAQGPHPVAVAKLDDVTFVQLKNSLAQFHVFAWQDVYTCQTVVCHGDHGTATLQVNLNGENKQVTWPIAATGLPEGLLAMVQQIKDAV